MLTILINSFERQEALERTLRSVHHWFPRSPVIVADCSKVLPEVNWKNEQILKLPYDSGLSAGRNALLAECQTEYFLLMDDDTVITSAPKEKELEQLLEESGADVLGGVVFGIEDWKGVFRKHNRRLIHLFNQSRDGYYDFIPNFFLGRTRDFQDRKWDDGLKICEHSDFFYRNKLKCAITERLSSSNCRDRNAFYSSHRGRIKEFQKKEKQRLGVNYFDYLDPDKIRTLIVAGDHVFTHPLAWMQEFAERLGNNNGHQVTLLSESEAKHKKIQWYKYNLFISCFSWFGVDVKPKGLRSVYISDDLHWHGNPVKLAGLVGSIEQSDLFLTPYANLVKEVDELNQYADKSVIFPHSLPWWFEPNKWNDRQPLIACAGGTHKNIYPLRTEIYESGDKSISTVPKHCGYDIREGKGIFRERYVKWLNQYQGGVATIGYGRFNGKKLPYLVAKYFEVAALTCPFFEELPGLNELGFKPYINYVPISKDNWREVFADWLSRPDDMRDIFINSSGLVCSYHMTDNRIKYFWRTIKERFGWSLT